MDLMPLVHNLVSSIPEALILARIDGTVLEFNQRAAVLIPELHIGASLAALIPELSHLPEGIVRINARNKSLLCTLNHQPEYISISLSRSPDEPAQPGDSSTDTNSEALHNLGMNLAKARNLSELYREAVTWGRKLLGLKHMSILLYDPDMHALCGTWGTSEDGTTQDESNYRASLSKDVDDVFKHLKESRLISVWEQDSPQSVNLKSRWTSIATLWDDTQAIGWLAGGNGPNEPGLDSLQHELFLAYARTISNLITSKRREEELEAAVALQTLEVEKREAHFRELSETLQFQKEEIEKLFTIMAHDLRGPLGVLRSLIITASDQRQLLTPADMLEMLPDMNESVEATYSLLENLLDWVRSQMKEISVLKEWRPVESFLASMHTWMDRIARNKGIEIVTWSDMALQVFADQRMLETVLRNLVSNAIKFSTTGSRVSIGVECPPGEESILFKVSDQGIGMSAEQLAQVFVMRDKRRSNGTAGEKGSGLGLMFSQDLARRMGGIILVESVLGKGSTFTLRLPNPVEGELPPAP